jgi:hypothetical protein
VFFEIPIDLAITLIGTPSARCNRRISAQSSTDNTPYPPASRFEDRVSEGVSFQLPSEGQFSRVVDTHDRPDFAHGVNPALESTVRHGRPGTGPMRPQVLGARPPL